MSYKNFAYLCLFFFLSNPVKSSIDDYIYPYSSPSFNEYGSLGLIRMPSARFHEEGTIAFHWSQNDPYTRGSIIAYPFNWFEASYQYTDVNNALYSNVESFSGNQTYKDKGFDVKFRLLKERNLFPAIAIGIRDIAGTATFAAEYLVASKKIDIQNYLNNFSYVTTADLTFGLGWGDLSYSKLTNPLTKLDSSFERRTLIQDTQGGEFSPGRYFSGPMGVFGGIEIPLPNLNGMKFKIEYDGTDYKEEGFPFGRKSFRLAFEPIKQSQSRINYGVSYPLNNYVQIYGAFTKGNTLSFGFTLSAGFGKKNPVVKSYEKLKSVDNQILRRELADGDDETLMILAMDILAKNDIHVAKGKRDKEVMTVLYAQNKYMSHVMASGRAVQALDQVAPEYIKTFRLETTNAGSVMNSISIDRETFNKYKKIIYII